MFDWFGDFVGIAQGWLYENLVQPLLFAAGLINYGDQAYDALEWVVIGAVEVAVMAVVLGWCERRWSAEPLVDRAAVRTDVLYTLLHRLGAFPLVAFALLVPAFDALEAALRLDGFSRLSVDEWWPGVTDLPVVSFMVYLVLLDFVDYWMHRGQHRFAWWWALHAVHHSQRQMTFWSDNRNHLIDDLLRDAVLAALAVVVGVPPGQFIALTVASRVIQSVHHGNLRWRWGGPAERLLVSPSFHRLHHSIGYGHEGPARGCNFAVLFPVWDVIFRTADFRPGFVPTGIGDQLRGRDYGRGFWAQQWLALRRLAHRA
jgi:sterol desaturase/sphingolipid hydroxylase (fatty acid hydroxylase superfamily)